MSKDILKPSFYNDVVYENNKFLIKKICFWPECSLYKDKESGLFKVSLPGSKGFNVGGPSTLARSNGERATDNEYFYLGDFEENLCLVGIEGKGYGYIDSKMDFIVPPKYNRAEEFHNGYAVVSIYDNDGKQEKWIFIDKKGKECDFEKQYTVIENNSEGLFRVSDLNMGGFWGFLSLAYHSDYDSNAGIWGYVDCSGKEIIKPQYIYAFDFQNGLALVCKGKWTKDKKWDNECNTGKYWTDEELWGMIDKYGNEVVPCKFDEIKFFWGDSKGPDGRDSRYLQAHFGGWKEGKWGIIDYKGNWVIEPIFEDLGYDLSNEDYFGFYEDDKWSNPDNVKIGIYSIKDKRVMFDPQFLAVDFLDNGYLKVEIYDDYLKQKIEKIIDYNGIAIFPSTYMYLFESKEYFETMIENEKGDRFNGILDKQGNEIFPCKYRIPWRGIFFEQKRIVFEVDKKCGLMTFDEKIIIEPQYTTIHNMSNILMEAKIGGKEGLIDEGREGLLDNNGEVILPFESSDISIKDDLIISQTDRGTILYKIIKKD